MGDTYHPYYAWEEYHAGMWSELPEDEDGPMSEFTLPVMQDAEVWGRFMRQVVHEWPVSSEHHLDNPLENEIAWIGQAATCLAVGAPEYITRRLWWRLTDAEQDAANEQARQAIEEWRTAHGGRQTCLSTDWV